MYVNQGIPAINYISAKQGIDVKGKIVIARYGKAGAGIKPKVAYEHGAIGCIMYSDPHDDGYFRATVIPRGPSPAGWSAARQRTGHDARPRRPSVAGLGVGNRLATTDPRGGNDHQQIPVLPISCSDATPLLANLYGPVAPEQWRGALPFTYHLGPGSPRCA